MRKSIFATLTLSALALCADQTSDIQAKFEEAGVSWRLADQGDNEQVRYIVFIPDEQNFENHTEKLIVYLSKKQPMPSPETFDANIKQIIRFFSGGLGSKFSHENKETLENKIFTEFSEEQKPSIKGLIKSEQVEEGNLLVGYFSADEGAIDSKKAFFTNLIQWIH